MEHAREHAIVEVVAEVAPSSAGKQPLHHLAPAMLMVCTTRIDGRRAR
jgi:hypothetical protein